MEGPRSCEPGEREDAIALIDRVFRSPFGCPPSMGREFPALLGEGNVGNMLVQSEGGRVVSVLSYYPSTMLIEGCPIRAASIGAVCTDPGYEGRGLSTALLAEADRRMRGSGVDLMLVSGERGLYARNGCVKAGAFERFTARPGFPAAGPVDAIRGGEAELPAMASLHRREATRFSRSLDEFRLLFRGATTSWHVYSFETFLARRGGRPAAYLVIAIEGGQARKGRLVEYAGDRGSVLDGVAHALAESGLQSLDFYCGSGDPLGALALERGLEASPCCAHGTVKILGFGRMMGKLRPYFAQRVPDRLAASASFSEEENDAIIAVGGERLRLGRQRELALAVFGGGDRRWPRAAPEVRDFVEAAFPLPMAWTRGLNYQ